MWSALRRGIGAHHNYEHFRIYFWPQGTVQMLRNALRGRRISGNLPPRCEGEGGVKWNMASPLQSCEFLRKIGKIKKKKLLRWYLCAVGGEYSKSSARWTGDNPDFFHKFSYFFIFLAIYAHQYFPIFRQHDCKNTGWTPSVLDWQAIKCEVNKRNRGRVGNYSCTTSANCLFGQMQAFLRPNLRVRQSQKRVDGQLYEECLKNSSF